MTRQSNHIVKAVLISALIVIGGASSIASASNDRGRHRHTSTCGHYQSQSAGRIFIDGYSTRIRSDRPMLRQIVRAFREAGYSAWISNGSVRVDYGHHRPSVRWNRNRFNARFNWDYEYGELSISLRRSNAYNGYRPRSHRPIRSVRRSIGWAYCD